MKKTICKVFDLYLALMLLTSSLYGESKRNERKSMLDQESDVVYISEIPDLKIELDVIQEAPVYSDKDGKIKLGTLKKNQKVPLEAITDRAYRVRGQGTIDGIAGWVAPWAFTTKDPQFVEQLKKFYQRQIEIRALIAKKEIAIGMTTAEVIQVLGKPTKSTIKQGKQGQSGTWEYITYKEQKNYIAVRDPKTGELYRQLVSITQVETEKRIVEFNDNLVSSIENITDKGRSNAQIVIPPIIFTK